MNLYWKNADASGLFDNVANWFEDAAATHNHGTWPTSGDDCSLATGETGHPQITEHIYDLGNGICTIPNLTLVRPCAATY